jgi:putative sporulation protein YtxC
VGTWVIRMSRDATGQLGFRLAGDVPGEWEEAMDGSGVSYRRRLDPMRRDVEADQLARALATFVADDYWPHWIRDTMRRHYPHFSPEDQDTVLAHAHARLGIGRDVTRRRTGVVHERVRQFLDEHDQIVVDGVLTFLLKDLADDIEEAVDRAVDDLLLEREHREFLNLLRGFLTLQTPKVIEAHVVQDPGGFRLEDRAGARVADEVLADLAETQSPEGTADDLLLSALLTLAPQHVVVHRGVDEAEGLAMVEAVFQDRVERCTGCRRCSGPRPALDGTSRPR